MTWLDFLKREQEAETPVPAAPVRFEIPLFPLSTVLFPAGILSLKVFEPRYLDMATACMKDHAPFGVCLIASGKEVGEPAVPHTVGTLAHIDRGDVPQLGMLMLEVHGGQRFRILSQRTEPDGLLRAEVELFEEKAPQAIPPAQQGLLPLLHKVASDVGLDKMPEPHHFDDAAWVGYRLTEVMPVQPLAKQKLLELEDPVSRLEILYTYLAQRKLVN